MVKFLKYFIIIVVFLWSVKLNDQKVEIKEAVKATEKVLIQEPDCETFENIQIIF